MNGATLLNHSLSQNSHPPYNRAVSRLEHVISDLVVLTSKKNPIEEGGDLTYEDEMDDEWETVDIIPMRKAVSKTYSGYSISVYKLTKLILNYIDPICS